MIFRDRQPCLLKEDGEDWPLPVPLLCHGAGDTILLNYTLASRLLTLTRGNGPGVLTAQTFQVIVLLA